MFGALLKSRRLNRQVMMTLAALAVVIKALIPAGYMIAPPTNDRPFAIVLCTAQGMVEVQPGQTMPGHEAPAQDDKSSAPCVFAGHALTGPAPEDIAFLPSEAAIYPAYLPAAVDDAPPTFTLARPPMPARGPPTLTI